MENLKVRLSDSLKAQKFFTGPSPQVFQDFFFSFPSFFFFFSFFSPSKQTKARKIAEIGDLSDLGICCTMYLDCNCFSTFNKFFDIKSIKHLFFISLKNFGTHARTQLQSRSTRRDLRTRKCPRKSMIGAYALAVSCVVIILLVD